MIKPVQKNSNQLTHEVFEKHNLETQKMKVSLKKIQKIWSKLFGPKHPGLAKFVDQ